QKKKAEDFGRQAQEENRAGRYGEAMRRYHEGTAAMRGADWTPQVEMASSLTGKLDHAMLESGKKVTISLAPLYSVNPETKLQATVSVSAARRQPKGAQDAGNREPAKSIAAAVAVDGSKLPFSESVTLPDLATGDYNLEVRLAPADGGVAEGMRATFVKA